MRLMGFDVETSGELPEYALQPHRAREGRAWLTSSAVAWTVDGEIHTAGKTRPGLDHLRHMLRSAAAHRVRIVGWNVCFDIAWLLALGLREEVFACQWLDAMLLWKHLTAHSKFLTDLGPKSYGLDAAILEAWPDTAPYWEGIDYHDDSPEMVARRLAYNKLDSAYALQLAHRYLGLMTPTQTRAALIEAACLPMVAETWVTGIDADAEAARTLGEQLDTDAKVAFVKLKLKSPEVTSEILGSPAQLAELLFSQWRLPILRVTAAGQASTDKEVLTELALTEPRCALIHTFRDAVNNKRKFCDSTLAALDYNGDGCVRPQARVGGTYTGRMTYSSKQGKGKQERQTGVALHQWKRDKAFRKIIRAPDGYTLLEFDFAGQEYRWMGVLSGDETMLSLCRPGEDGHTFLAAQISGDDYRKLLCDVASGVVWAEDRRQMGKVGNLSLQYKTSWKTLQRIAFTDYGLVLSMHDAIHIHRTYARTYPRVPLYWQRQTELGQAYGWIETPAGRRVQVGQSPAWDFGTRWTRSLTCINAPIQGAGADQKYLALMVLRDYLPKVDGRLLYELHDGLFVVVPDAQAERAAHEIKSLLSNLPYKQAWGVDLPIDFPVDAKWGKSWGELRAVA